MRKQGIPPLQNKWPEKLVQQHQQKYGPGAKAELRARNALYFADFFGRSGVDHVHVHFANRAAHTGLFVKEISGIPFSITAHGQDFMKDLGSDDLLREICAAAEFVAAETDYSRDLLRQRCPDSAAKIYRVYNGMDLERFPGNASTQRGGYSALNTPPRIVSVGRLVAFKGFEDLIDACAELTHRGVEFVCDIIGDGPLRDALQAKIEKLDLSSRVNLLGSLSQNAVLEKLQAADIFVLASTTDAQGATDVFPTVILEAMASERPVISTRLAGIPELVVDGETGLLVAPGDVPALTQALEQLLRDFDLRLRYGQAGRARIEQCFQIEQTVAPLIEMFERSCSRRRTASQLTARPIQSESRFAREAATEVAYLIDRWPDQELPLLERELGEMKRRDVPIVLFVCELNSVCATESRDERNCAVSRISAGCDGVGSGMAGKPDSCTKIGRRPRTTEQPCTRRSLLAASPLCARAPEIASRAKRVARSRYEFASASVRAHAKEASGGDSKRYDRAPIGIIS